MARLARLIAALFPAKFAKSNSSKDEFQSKNKKHSRHSDACLDKTVATGTYKKQKVTEKYYHRASNTASDGQVLLSTNKSMPAIQSVWFLSSLFMH